MDTTITEADIEAVRRLRVDHSECRSEAELTTMLQVAFAAHRIAERERITAKLSAFDDATKLTLSALAANGFSNIGISEGGMMARQLPSGRKLIVLNFSVGYRVYIDSVSDGFVCTLTTIGQLAHLLAALEVRP